MLLLLHVLDSTSFHCQRIVSRWSRSLCQRCNAMCESTAFSGKGWPQLTYWHCSSDLTQFVKLGQNTISRDWRISSWLPLFSCIGYSLYLNAAWLQNLIKFRRWLRELSTHQVPTSKNCGLGEMMAHSFRALNFFTKCIGFRAVMKTLNGWRPRVLNSTWNTFYLFFWDLYLDKRDCNQ